jgi:hypothetical protein
MLQTIIAAKYVQEVYTQGQMRDEEAENESNGMKNDSISTMQWRLYIPRACWYLQRSPEHLSEKWAEKRGAVGVSRQILPDLPL